MKSIDLARGTAARTGTVTSERLSVRSSAAVIGLTSLLLWASIIWVLA